MSKKLLQYYQTKMNKGGKILPKYQSTGLFTGLIDPRQRAASESTNSGIQNKVAQQIDYQNISNKNAEQKVKQLMEKGNYSEAHARRAVRTNEPQASKIIENITNDNYRIQMHPDYDPRKSLESQSHLLNDNSLRTRVLRGANMFTNTGNTGADFAAGLITAPGRSFANLSLDANKRYFNPNNTGLGNFANFAEDVINVAPSLIPKAAGALGAAENAISRGSKMLYQPKISPTSTIIPFDKQSNFNFLNKLSEEEFGDYVSRLTPKQKNILYGLDPVDIDQATRSKLAAALEVGDNPVIGTRGTISEHKNNWYGIDPEDYLPEDIHTAKPEAWDYVQKNHLNQGDARNHLLDLFSREGVANSEGKLVNTLAKKPLTILKDNNYLKSDLIKNNQISNTEIQYNRQKQIDWLRSDEYLKRRSRATGESASEIKKDVENIIKKGNSAQISLTEPWSNKIRGEYWRGKIPEIRINNQLERNEALGTFAHEDFHNFSQFATNNNYKNYPRIRAGNWFQRTFHPQGIYINKPYEQQVRGLKLLDFIDETQGIPRGVELKPEDIDKFAYNISNEGPHADIFKQQYGDVIDMLRGAIQRNKGKSIRPELLKFLNDVYTPAGIILGAGTVANNVLGSESNINKQDGGLTDAGYKLGLDLIEYDNQLKEGGSLPIYQQRGQVSSIEYTTQNSSNNKGNQFSDYSRIINSYPNRPNDTTYTYNSQLPNNNVESFYYNTGQNNKGGIPTGQLQNNRSFLNPNQEQVSSYLKLINDKFKYKKGGPIVDPRGQWAHPGEVTRIPSSKITMQGIPYPVYGVGSNGKKQMMYPNQEYDFGNAKHVDEFPMMQGGGLWNTNKRAWVDSIHNARRGDLNFVKRYFDPSAGSIQIPGEQGTSTHFMEWGDKRAYPTVVQMQNGKLQYLNQNDKNAAWNYAKRTGQFIQFPNDEQAEWYANNGYKQGTNVLKYQVGGEKEPEPYFKTAEDRENYRKKLKEVSEAALNNNGSDENLLLNTSYHNIENGNNCINGICGLNIAAGLKYNKPTDQNRFLSGEKFAVAVGQGDEDYYQVNGNFQIGDHLQYRHTKGADSHNKIIYDITTDKEGNKIYKVIDNGGGKDMKSRDYTEAELKEVIEKGAGGYDKVNVYRPGYALDKPLLEKERENTVAGKAAADRFRRVSWEKSHNPGYKYSIRKDSPYYEDQPEGMQKFIAFANDDSKINDLVKKLGVDKETVHDELLNTFGELGQENKWEDRTFGGTGGIENTVEKIFKPKSWSIGPGQIKFNAIDPELKKKFNITKPRDLYDFDKIIPLMTAMNIKNRKWMENKGKDLSNYLIGKPGIDASQLDGGVGRWTPYMYPGSLTNPVDVVNKEIAGTDLYGKELTNERNRLIRKNARLFDEGSYAGQVFNKIDQNLERTLPGEYFEIPQDMQPVVIKSKPKKQEGGSLNRTVTCSNCGHSWKLSDGGKDPVTCHNCGGQIKMKYGGPLPKYQVKGAVSKEDSVAHQANKILQYEQLRGGPGGIPLPQYSDPRYKQMLMQSIYPEVQRIMPNATAMESAEAMDFIFNAGWDKAANKITKDPRAFALQEYYRQNNKNKLDSDGKWSGRKNPAYSFDQEYNATIGQLPENQRRILMNKGRDWYYQNINNPAPGVPNPDYYNTWYGRIWNTNDYNEFNPNNPKFIPNKKSGGRIKNK